MGTLRAVTILTLVIAMTAVVLPLHLIAHWLRWPLRKRTARAWHRGAARIMGLRVRVHGKPGLADGHGVLIAANHASWLDIVALGAVAEVSFIAKDEVRQWPVFGLLARLQDSVFIARNARAEARGQAETVAARLVRGDTMVLFAEGTTGDGNFVLPFKSALFGAAGIGEANGMAKVQPVAIAYTRIDGMPTGRFWRPLISWPGDTPLVPHLWRLLCEGPVDVAIAFGTPIAADPSTDRKQLAAAAETSVRTMLAALLREREPPSTHGQNALKTRP